VTASVENKINEYLLRMAVHDAVLQKCGHKWGDAPEVLKQGAKKFMHQNSVAALVRTGAYKPDPSRVESISQQMCFTGDFSSVYDPSLSQYSMEALESGAESKDNAENVISDAPADLLRYSGINKPSGEFNFGFTALLLSFCSGALIGAVSTHYYLLLKMNIAGTGSATKTLRRPEL
jgi:hypothetical protein